LPESSQPSDTPKRQATTSNGHVKRNTGLSQQFVDILGWVITVMWALSMMLHAANVGYEPPASIHLLMMAVAGTAFGTNLIKPKNGATKNND
jgi:hypothetical protein